jgi:hypothetical protein
MSEQTTATVPETKELPAYYLLKVCLQNGSDNYTLYNSYNNALNYVQTQLKAKFDECHIITKKIFDPNPTIHFDLTDEIVNVLSAAPDAETTLFKITYRSPSFGPCDWDDDEIAISPIVVLKKSYNVERNYITIKWLDFLKNCKTAFSNIKEITVNIENEDKSRAYYGTKSVILESVLRIHDNVIELEKLSWDLHRVSDFVNRYPGTKFRSFYYHLSKVDVVDGLDDNSKK